MAGDYSFEPPEYWEDVSEKAKDFIRGCLTVDPAQRLTAKQCVNHPWLSLEVPVEKEADLLPTVRQNFNARRFATPKNHHLTIRTFHAAIDAIKAINIMKNGGAMDGAFSHSPQAVRDAAAKADSAAAQQGGSGGSQPSQRSGGLWGSKHTPPQ